ncbi:DUF4829 domain-containing protein [Romboutsia lituseburensis]|uniref:DUF4829 domain-containing protein n=1 Tax=Romboutsia lituseburensis TaxID=1537 RepID=UPI0022EA21F0|nr:DUF4829 domain-containing protein [Romboutsia lituseburensis]
MTVKSEGFGPIEDAEQVVREYFLLKNEKNVDKLSSLLVTNDSLSSIEEQLKYLDKTSLIYIKEETNESILNAYLKHNELINQQNLKVYKVNYEISYNDSSPIRYKNGMYESWFFVVRKNNNSKWLIDINDIH